MSNLELYNKVKEVPQNALKSFDNGTFKGTDINTMWRIKKLTEVFGLCGVGWCPEIIREWSEKGVNDELLCFVEIKLYIKQNDEWSKGISATGGSKIVQYFKSKDYNKNNDEGYKMAATDALGVACKFLGFGADVYWANDKTKYTAEKEQAPIEYATKEQIKQLKLLVPDTNAVCVYCKVEKLEQITKARLAEIIANKQKQANNA